MVKRIGKMDIILNQDVGRARAGGHHLKDKCNFVHLIELLMQKWFLKNQIAKP